ncbi:hypothetical protein FQA39_LY09740 [Lamprigera yunnana]|nr:hypothetical protein FQA39_LY09740 [Lamprigera yunnana]
MEESFGAQYALQIALQTLRERCQEFQQRIIILEQENLNLRSKLINKDDFDDGSLPEVDTLREQVTQLSEQNLQLTNNVVMVSTENRRLWTRLSKLTQLNENLGSKLTKINDTLSQPNVLTHSPLVRSKTFTQDEPHTKLIPKNVTDENNRISLELEDISLKLICNIAKEKNELELQCSQMTEIQSNEAIFVNSFAFTYDDVDGSILEFDQYLQNLNNVRNILLEEKEKLLKDLSNLKSTPVQCRCTIIKEPQIAKMSKSVQTKCEEKASENLVPNRSQLLSKNENELICPMCSKVFNSSHIKFEEFQEHVEGHFSSDIDNIDATM